VAITTSTIKEKGKNLSDQVWGGRSAIITDHYNGNTVSLDLRGVPATLFVRAL